jgi:hypothetical protein
MSIGHAVSAASVAAIGTAYAAAKAITLGEYPTRDARSKALPDAGAILGRLEATLGTVDGASQVTPCLCHDAAGDQPFWEGDPTTLGDGLTTAATKTAAWDLSVTGEVPWDAISANTGKLYLFLRGDAGTFTCTYALLWWRDEE